MADVDFLKNQEGMNDVPLEGEILSPSAATDGDDQEFNTLDEPVRETIMRDLKAIGVKFWHVLYPKQSKALLKEWDLWGPLILCVFMAIMLQGSDDKQTNNKGSQSDGGPQFAEVFVIFWVGAVVVTLNTKLLGGNISFFQSICVLGYCVCPLTVALIVCRIILIASQTTVLFIIRFVVVILAFGWSTFASTAFLADSQPSHRKALAIYPIFLFYFVISWLIISHTHTT
uniref:Protein YIPF n=1 Tax=Crassostrea virginica TaxID=6565 RepID=A0A8B8DK36_CRAVI|nr:protein YIPF6-like [Crassostrea virginica]